jgi:transposase
MDRVSLEQLLGQGLSLAEIGSRFDLHEATVGYWVKKHGLEAANRDKHVARGGIAKDCLETSIEEELSIAQIAGRVGLSKATVRHWLKQYDLKTHAQKERLGERSTRADKAAGRATVMWKCRRHGMTEFWLEGSRLLQM